MTVYAVPQVLAATMPAGLVSTQTGALVKLIRVMMLGPVVACIAVFARSLRADRSAGAIEPNSFFKTVPWFIVGFFALATLRSLSLIPDGAVFPLQGFASILTIMSMAALGLGVDLRVIGRVGGKVTAAVARCHCCFCWSLAFAWFATLRRSDAASNERPEQQRRPVGPPLLPGWHPTCTIALNATDQLQLGHILRAFA